MTNITCTSASIAELAWLKLYFFSFFCRADFADDEYIQELIRWTHPHTIPQVDFQYTESENMAMLRLPRKECMYFL